MAAKLYKSNGEVNDIKPKNGKTFTLDEVQSLVGGYVEVSFLNSKQIMLLNEEGTGTVQ
jgi:hypothetical protein